MCFIYLCAAAVYLVIFPILFGDTVLFMASPLQFLLFEIRYLTWGVINFPWNSTNSSVFMIIKEHFGLI